MQRPHHDFSYFHCSPEQNFVICSFPPRRRGSTYISIGITVVPQCKMILSCRSDVRQGQSCECPNAAKSRGHSHNGLVDWSMCVLWDCSASRSRCLGQPLDRIMFASCLQRIRVGHVWVGNLIVLQLNSTKPDRDVHNSRVCSE